MSEPPTKFAPRLGIRLAVWFIIYFAGTYLYVTGRAVKDLPGYTWLSDFGNNALHFPENLQLLILGSLGLNLDNAYSQAVLVFGYTCYLINFALCFKFTDRRSFWILIGVLAFLIVLSLYGSSYYVSMGIVHKAFEY